MKNPELLRLFHSNIECFISTGSPIFFGRIEGMKDAVLALGMLEDLEAMKKIIEDNYDRMSKMVVNP